jgi:hypothetical protein
MNDRVVNPITAAVMVPTTLAAIRPSRFGSISTAMIRLSGSPLALAARTKSRLRSDIVCARSTRAPHAHPVRPSTAAMTHSGGSSKSEATMMMSGRPGITRNTLASAESDSLFHPVVYPATTPTTTAIVTAMTVARMPTTMTPRAPQMIWLNTSSPRWVVPSQCSADGGWSRARASIWVAGNGASHSAKIAMSRKNPRMIRPAIDLPLRNIAKAEPILLRSDAGGGGGSAGTAALASTTCCVLMAQASVWRVRGSRKA